MIARNHEIGSASRALLWTTLHSLVFTDEISEIAAILRHHELTLPAAQAAYTLPPCHTKALNPVMDLPTIKVFISLVPS
jgi:hypothetical protein